MKLVFMPEAAETLKQLNARLKERYPASDPSFRAVASAIIDQFGADASDLALRRIAEKITPPESKRKAWLEEIARLAESATPEQLARFEKSIKKLQYSDDAPAVVKAEIQQKS